MDRALWISWYDLADADREAYFQWLQQRYIPQRLAQSGFLWAAHFKSEVNPRMSGVPLGEEGRLRHTDDPALPKGNAYILIFGAETPHAFANPTPGKLHAGLAQEDRAMLARRGGERVNIMIAEDRVDGPDAGARKPGAALSPCIQLGSFNPGSADEEEIMAWYAQWRLPSLSKLPGSVGMRKLVSVAGWAKHGVLYEFTSLAARNEHFPDHEQANPEMAAWTDRFVRKLLHAPGSPNLAQRIHSAVRK